MSLARRGRSFGAHTMTLQTLPRRFLMFRGRARSKARQTSAGRKVARDSLPPRLLRRQRSRLKTHDCFSVPRKSSPGARHREHREATAHPQRQFRVLLTHPRSRVSQPISARCPSNPKPVMSVTACTQRFPACTPVRAKLRPPCDFKLRHRSDGRIQRTPFGPPILKCCGDHAGGPAILSEEVRHLSARRHFAKPATD